MSLVSLCSDSPQSTVVRVGDPLSHGVRISPLDSLCDVVEVVTYKQFIDLSVVVEEIERRELHTFLCW